LTLHRENGFAEVYKNLEDTDPKIILFVDHENSYVGRSNWLLECLNVLQHCHQRLSILHNYFNSAKLFSDLVKFLDTLAKPFFSYDLW